MSSHLAFTTAKKRPFSQCCPQYIVSHFIVGWFGEDKRWSSISDVNDWQHSWRLRSQST